MSNTLKTAIEAIYTNFNRIAHEQNAKAEAATHPAMAAKRKAVAASYMADLKGLVAFITNGATESHESLAEYICDEGYLTWADERGNTTAIYAVTGNNGWLGKGVWFINKDGLVREQVGDKRLVKVTAIPNL